MKNCSSSVSLPWLVWSALFENWKVLISLAFFAIDVSELYFSINKTEEKKISPCFVRCF